MKNRIKLLTSVFVMTLFALGASAQNYDYEYNDNVVVVNDYDNDRAYKDNRRGDRKYDDRRPRNRANNNNGRVSRKWKASILDRAYAIAAADGRITRREKREIRGLEDELGIYRLDRNRRRVCR